MVYIYGGGDCVSVCVCVCVCESVCVLSFFFSILVDLRLGIFVFLNFSRNFFPTRTINWGWCVKSCCFSFRLKIIHFGVFTGSEKNIVCGWYLEK